MRALVLISIVLTSFSVWAQSETLKDLDPLRQEIRAAIAANKIEVATAAYEKAIPIARRSLSDQPVAVENFLEEAARFYRKQEDHERAANLWDDIATSRNRRLGENHWQSLDARLERDEARLVGKLPEPLRRRALAADVKFERAMSLRNENRHAEAIELFEVIFSERSAVLGADHRLVADVQAWIGWSTNALKLIRKSGEAFRAAAAIREKYLQNVSHPHLGWDLLGLSYSLHTQGQLEEASQTARRALMIHEAAVGKKHGNWTAAQAHLINVLKDLIKLSESRNDSSAARKQQLEVASLQLELADVHESLNELNRGEPYLNEAVQTLGRLLGDRNDKTLEALQRLVRWHLNAGELAKAEGRSNDLVKLRGAVPGPGNSLQTGALLLAAEVQDKFLSQLTLNFEERARRLALYQKVAEQAQQLLQSRAEPTPESAQALGYLARAAFFRNDIATQRRLASDAVATHRKLQDTQSLNYSRSLNLLALADLTEGKLSKAEEQLREVEAIRKKVLGDRHIEYAAVLNNLALLSTRQNQHAKAAEWYAQALRIYQQRLNSSPNDVPLFLRTASMLSQSLENSGRGEAAARLWESVAKARHWPDSFRATILLQSAAAWKLAHSAGNADYSRVRSLAVLALQSSVSMPLSPETIESHLADRKRLLTIVEETEGPKSWQAIDAKVSIQRAEEWQRLTPSQRAELVKASELDRTVETSFSIDPHARLADARNALNIRAEIQGAGHPDWAATNNNLGMLLRYVGQYGEAADCLRKATEARRTRLGLNHPQTAISTNNLGLIYHDIHNLAQASVCFRQSHDALKAALPPEHEAITDSLNNQSVLRLAMNDIEEAHKLARECLEVFRKRIALPEEQRNRMAAYPGIRQALSGETNWSGVLTSRSYAAGPAAVSDRVPLGVYLNNLARAEARLNLVSAKKTFEEALAQFESVLNDAKLASLHGLARKEKAITQTNLAVYLIDRGELAQAEPLLKQALEDRRLLVGPKHPDFAGSLTTLGNLQFRRKQLAEAAESMTRAADIYRESHGPRSYRYAAALANRALILDAAGDPRQAYSLLQEAVAITHQDLQATAAAQSEREQLATVAVQRGFLDHLLSLGSRLKSPPDELYADVLQWKGMVFLRQQKRRERRQMIAANPAAARLFRELDDVVRQIARVAGATNDFARNRAAQLTRRKEEIERELSLMTRPSDDSVTTLKALRESLPADVVLVDYLAYHSIDPASKAAELERETSLLMFIITRDKPAEVVYLGPIKPIATAIADWRSGTRREWPQRGPDDPAAVLREKLWLPVDKYLQTAKTVLISPDTVLAQLPFAALPGKDSKKYLLEECAIAIIPSPQVLPKMLREERKSTLSSSPNILIVGDVDFNALPGSEADRSPRTAVSRSAANSNRWPALPGTRGEMLMIRDSYERKYPFPDGQLAVLRGAKATEENFRRYAPDHRWLHLSTHGFFAGEQPQSPSGQESRHGSSPGFLSGIVLAGANFELDPIRDDGVLTAVEVAELDLSGVDMAVLSACETGLGSLTGGEGIIGVQRAFQVAGTRSVVSSLWTVDDEATRKLMERFYENSLHKPMSRLEALREAQLWLLGEAPKRGMVRLDKKPPAGQPPRTPPYYWAAFVLSGDWR